MTPSPYVLVAGAAPLAGNATFYSELLSSAARVVAADAAGEWCVSLGRVPDVVVGDFDSALPGAAERLEGLGAEVVRLPREKDVTDLDAAVDVARQRFESDVVLCAAFSEAVDHTLASFGTLLRAPGRPVVREPDWTGYVVRPGEPLRVPVGTGRTFSVLAPAGAEGVAIEGAAWELADAHLDPLSGRGVSNVTSGDILSVSVRKGALIVAIR